MPESPMKRKLEIVNCSILTNGRRLPSDVTINEITIEKAVGEISTARIVIHLPMQRRSSSTFKVTDSSRLHPGNAIEIQLGYEGRKNVRVFQGIISNVGIRIKEDVQEFILDCSDMAIRMTVTKRNQLFQEMKDSDVFNSIINDNRLKAKLDNTKYVHPQLVQYDSTDWNFLQTRAEANGMLLYADDGIVSIRKPGFNAKADLTVTYGKDVISLNGKVDARYQFRSAETKGWSLSSQKMKVQKSKEPIVNPQGNLKGDYLAAKQGHQKNNFHSAGEVGEEDLKGWADGLLMKNRLAKIYGDVEFAGSYLPKLNTIIEIDGFSKRVNGKALITKINHHVADGEWRTTVGFGLSPDQLNNSSSAHHPSASGLLPAVFGLQNGKVKKIENDPNGEMRVLVDVPVFSEKSAGIWARLSNFYATSSKGAFFIPEVGDEVVVGFINNDPRHPIILGSLYSSRNPAPYYNGEVDYGDRAEHCWNGDHENGNHISRLRYHRMFIKKYLDKVDKIAPKGADLRSWRY